MAEVTVPPYIWGWRSMTASTVLIIEDDPAVSRPLGRMLKRDGHLTPLASSIAEACSLYSEHSPDVVLLDFSLPDGTALDFLRWAEANQVTAAIFVLTGYGTIERAVDCIKSGAEQFLTKPVDFTSLRLMLERTLTGRRRTRQATAQQYLAERGRAWPFLGTSDQIRRLEELAQSVKDADVPVLVLGETGSGKGVLARWLHDNGPRAQEAMVDLNCAGLSKELAESELFGHERGSFTGASAEKRGLLEIAHRGTLFLDEIGDLDLSVQPKLLKVLEDRSFRRVGGVRSLSTDIRLIAATHRDLAQMSVENSFRNDLLFRINTVVFEVPPLRTRRSDIVPLANAILADLGRTRAGGVPALDGEAEEALTAYHWPGNVRELRNTLERATLFSPDGEIKADAFAVCRRSPSRPAPRNGHPRITLAQAERAHVLGVLRDVGANVTVACEILGIPRSSLYAKLKRWNLRPGDVQTD